MKARVVFFILLGLSCLGRAEVFKCQSPTGKILYQTSPCSAKAARQRVLDFKQRTPEEQESARDKLRSWQERQASEEAAKLQAAKERQLDRERQESLTLQRRSVIAQEQQAIAAQRQNQYRPGGVIYPYYPPCLNSPWDRNGWQQRYRPECDPRYRQYTPVPPYPYPPQQPWPVRQEPPPKRWSGKAIGSTPAPVKSRGEGSFFAPGR